MIKNQYQAITCNLKPAIRHDIMEGRPFIVAPMVMITEGVLNGSNGPLLYPQEELSKTPQVWNHKPVVVYHPKEGTACSPEVLSSRKIGVIMNTKFEDGKLKAEAWLEKDRVNAVDKRVMDAIENNTVLELSTGLFTDNEEVTGKFGDKEYTAIARNYRPDHLAILPDLKGACSIEDGAGFLRLNMESKVVNGKSFNEIRDLLQTQVKDAWICDIYDNYFIYEQNGKLFKQNYSFKKDLVKVSGVPEEVVRSISYKTVNGKEITNIERNNQMDKTKLVDALISNAATQWEESDRESLMALDEKVLNKMLPVENKKTPEEIAKEEAAKKAADEKASKNAENAKMMDEEEEKAMKDKKTACNQTAEEFISNAPKDIQEVLTNGLSSYKAEKAKVIATIVANKKNTFTKEQLETKNMDELKAIAALAVNEKPANYSGQGDTEVVDNAETPLVMPVMNFSAEKKK